MITDSRPMLGIDCEVLVVGGGAAGVAAAVAAAEQGMDVVLLERYGFCGGGAVAGLSGTVCGLYTATQNDSAAPLQVVHGFADRFMAMLQQRGGLGPALKYGKTWTHVHDPLIWREAADHVLRSAGVRVVLHSVVTAALVEGGELVEGAVAYTKQGLLTVKARITIDASGDADLMAMAGFRTFMGQNGQVQNPTMIFRLQGVDTGKFLSAYGADTIMPPVVSELIAQANSSGRFKLPRQKIWLFPTTRPDELLCNCTRILGADGRELNGVLARDLSEAEIEGRAQAREYANFFRAYLAGCENSFINDTGVQVGVRQTRQGVGRQRLRNDDILNGRKSRDGIARSPWPIELHTGARPIVNWLLDDWYEVPYECFVPERGQGLLFAGRCLSAEHEAVASARVTAQCFSYGQAIGLAAALSVRENVAVHRIEGNALRQILNQHNARLDD